MIRPLEAQGYAHGLFFAGGVGNSITNNTITNLTASSGNIGVEDDSNEVFASGNTISKLGAGGTGIDGVAFAVNNTISTAPTASTIAPPIREQPDRAAARRLSPAVRAVGYNN